VNSVAVSKNGKLVASGGGDGLVLIGDAKTLAVRHYLKGHTGAVRCVAFSPKGKVLASAGEDKTVRLWDVATGKPLGRLVKHTGAVNGVAFSRDGQRLLSGSADTTVRLWDVQRRKQLKCFSKHTTIVRCVAYSPDGLHGLSGSRGTDKDNKPQDCGARLWNLKTGKQIRRFETLGGILSAAFSPDGLRVITGGSHPEAAVRLWDVATGTPIHTLHGGSDRILCVAFFPSGKRAISGGADHQLRIGELKTPGEVRPFEPLSRAPESLAVYPDGRRVLVTAGNHVRLLDVIKAKEVRPIEAPIDSFLAFSADDRHFLTTSDVGRTVDLRELKAGKVLRRFKGHQSQILLSAWSADGRRFLTRSHHRTRVWQSNKGDKPKFFKLPHDPVQFNVFSVALSKDGKYALYGGIAKSGSHVRLIDVAKGKEVRGFGKQGDSAFYKVIFSHDSRQVFAPHGGSIRRWDRKTGKEQRPFEFPGGSIVGVIFSKDGRQMFLGGTNGSVWRWDLAKPGSQPKGLRKFFTGEVWPQAVSPDGQTLAVIVSRKILALVDGQTGVILREWKGAFPGDPQITAFTHDGKRLPVGNGNGTVYILDVARLLTKKDR
jgi:WD40 repeat protein